MRNDLDLLNVLNVRKHPVKDISGVSPRKYNLGKITYLAPIFSPAVGGGVVYLELLSSYLLASGYCDRFDILTEKFPGTVSVESAREGKLTVIRKYPFRAGRNTKTLISYLSYFWQNIQFFMLPGMVNKLTTDILIVHGSFLNNPTTLWWVLRFVRRFIPNVALVADLRDPKFPLRKIRSLKNFDLIISCSENISNRLMCDHDVYESVRTIPIIVRVVPPEKNEVEDVKSKYELNGIKYVFNGSGLSKEKGAEKLLDLVKMIRDKDYDVALVVIGKRRYWSNQLEQALQEGWLIYLGQVSHSDAMALAAGSWLDINLSSVDSMPRHSLEALIAGARVLLPKGIPEFERECPNNIAIEKSADELANKAIKIATGSPSCCGYNVSNHSPDYVIQKYVDALSDLANK